ncbi:MAG: RyR domain-containing protein [Firmicutes bacterium]|nr:RyR domain-containing protein [Bacillota bacterium]
MIKDSKLKAILEETTLFKYKTNNFDILLFNIYETGIRYSVCTNIDKILPENLKSSPEIMIVGLTEKVENALLNLAHCLTMQRNLFHFTIIENDETKIAAFQKKYHYLTDFVKIEFSYNFEDICGEKSYNSIFICLENQINSIKKAIEIHYFFGEKAPNILLFCNEIESFNTVLQEELVKKKIFLINLFEQLAHYVFVLNEKIETRAKEAHHFWNKIYKKNSEWDTLSEHFKQSSRNQILDGYLKTYIACGKQFENIGNGLITFTESEMETLAIMEHRRWMIEKFANHWILGERDNENKRHDCLVHWNELPDEQRMKDYDAIYLMIKLLNNRST